MNDARIESKPNMQSKRSPCTRTTYMCCTGAEGGVGQVLDTRAASGGYDWQCGKCQQWHFQLTNHAAQFVPFWHEHLGHEPVYIDSWKTYRRRLEELSPHAKNELAS